MARFKIGEEENIVASQNNMNDQLKFDWLNLKKTGDKVKVRFMYDKGETFEGFCVHNLYQNTDGAKRKFINCLRESSKNTSACPLCQAGYSVSVKFYIPCYDVVNKRVLLWERGSQIAADLKTIADKHEEKDWALVGTVFEITRQGDPNDTKTKYTFFNEGHDETTLADLVDTDGNPVVRPEVFGRLILDRPAEDMKAFLATGELPKRQRDGENHTDSGIIPRNNPTSELIDTDEIPF